MGDQVDDRKQDDGTQQGYQHGWNSDRIVDRPDVKDGAEEVTSQECAQDRHNDVNQQIRAVMHKFSRNPADHGSNEKVYSRFVFISFVNV